MGKKRNMKNKTIKSLGNVLMIAAIVFIIWRVYKQNLDFSLLLSPKVFAGLLGLTILYTSSVVLSAVFYTYLLHIISKKRFSWLNAVRLYSKTFLYRYIPGNIMHLLGRNSIAAEEDISYADINVASFLQMLILCVSACILAITLAAKYFIVSIQSITFNANMLIYVLPVIVVCIVLVVIFRKKLIRLGASIKEKILNISFPQISLAFIMSFMLLLLNAVVYLLCLYVLNGIMPNASIIPSVLGLFILSWLIGFIMPGAPAGIGIRETMLVVVLGGLISPDMLVFSAVVLRLISIIGDVVSFLVIQAIWMWKRRKAL
jgi:uncharacterized membrane protein YbhN (UPF0104 family)